MALQDILPTTYRRHGTPKWHFLLREPKHINTSYASINTLDNR